MTMVKGVYSLTPCDDQIPEVECEYSCIILNFKNSYHSFLLWYEYIFDSETTNYSVPRSKTSQNSLQKLRDHHVCSSDVFQLLFFTITSRFLSELRSGEYYFHQPSQRRIWFVLSSACVVKTLMQGALSRRNSPSLALLTSRNLSRM